MYQQLVLSSYSVAGFTTKILNYLYPSLLHAPPPHHLATAHHLTISPPMSPTMAHHILQGYHRDDDGGGLPEGLTPR